MKKARSSLRAGVSSCKKGGTRSMRKREFTLPLFFLQFEIAHLAEGGRSRGAILCFTAGRAPFQGPVAWLALKASPRATRHAPRHDRATTLPRRPRRLAPASAAQPLLRRALYTRPCRSLPASRVAPRLVGGGTGEPIQARRSAEVAGTGTSQGREADCQGVRGPGRGGWVELEVGNHDERARARVWRPARQVGVLEVGDSTRSARRTSSRSDRPGSLLPGGPAWSGAPLVLNAAFVYNKPDFCALFPLPLSPAASPALLSALELLRAVWKEGRCVCILYCLL